MKNFEKLQIEIVQRSEANEWKFAKLEWELLEVYFEPGNQCLCGHYPIKEVCVLENKKNGNIVEVGNVCVKSFFSIEIGGEIFKSYRKVIKDIKRSLTLPVIKFMYEKGIFNDKDYSFYHDIHRKRKLSSKQQEYKQGLNKKFIEWFETRNGIVIKQLKELMELDPFNSYYKKLLAYYEKNDRLTEKQKNSIRKDYNKKIKCKNDN